MKRALRWIVQIPVVVGVPLTWLAIDWVGLGPVLTLALLAMGILVGSMSFALDRRLTWTIPSAGLVGLVALASVLDLSPVQPATRAVQRIRPGMGNPTFERFCERSFRPAVAFTHRASSGPCRVVRLTLFSIRTTGATTLRPS